jgi:hypothetical protein
VIEAKLDRLFWIFERRSTTLDDLIAVANFRAIQHFLGQFGRFVVFVPRSVGLAP